jgi:hypothetical protein
MYDRACAPHARVPASRQTWEAGDKERGRDSHRGAHIPRRSHSQTKLTHRHTERLLQSQSCFHFLRLLVCLQQRLCTQRTHTRTHKAPRTPAVGTVTVMMIAESARASGRVHRRRTAFLCSSANAASRSKAARRSRSCASSCTTTRTQQTEEPSCRIPQLYIQRHQGSLCTLKQTC